MIGFREEKVSDIDNAAVLAPLRPLDQHQTRGAEPKLVMLSPEKTRWRGARQPNLELFLCLLLCQNAIEENANFLLKQHRYQPK